MSAGPDASAPLRHRPFLLYFWGRVFANFSRQIVAVAIGWQVYEFTRSPLHLGLVGLVQFIPTLLLTFYAGHAADRFERKRIVQICQWVDGTNAALLAWGTLAGWLDVSHLYLSAALFGTTTAFERPAGMSLLPNVVPAAMLQQSTALASGAIQFATIGGPALGGFMYAFAPGAPYAATAVFWLLAGLLNGAVPVTHVRRNLPAATWHSLFAGLRFVWSRQVILGTISLDLFVVLLGGAVALLPIFASEVLHTGAWGLGLLRSAPALGALVVTVLLTRYPLHRRVGMRMFQAVIAFGCATVVFGLSSWMWLSLAALVVMGAADEVSVVIRLSLVQLQTPDDMRGRVSAVNFLFVNASNQLGEFESGVVAALVGTVPAVLIGGVGSVLVALLWMRMFPALRKLQQLA